MPYRPISRGELQARRAAVSKHVLVSSACEGWCLLCLLAAMKILQALPLSLVKSTAVVNQKEGRTCEPRIHRRVPPHIEHQGKLGRPRIFSILQRLVLQLASRIVLQDRLR